MRKTLFLLCGVAITATPTLGESSSGTTSIAMLDEAKRARPSSAVSDFDYCDMTEDGALDVQDFLAFRKHFEAGNPEANCDGSDSKPTLTIADFTCFLQRFSSAVPAPSADEDPTNNSTDDDVASSADEDPTNNSTPAASSADEDPTNTPADR